MKPSGSFKITPMTGKPLVPEPAKPSSEPEKLAPFMPRQVDIQWTPIQTRKRGFRPTSTHQDMMKIDPPESRPESKPQE